MLLSLDFLAIPLLIASGLVLLSLLAGLFSTILSHTLVCQYRMQFPG